MDFDVSCAVSRTLHLLPGISKGIWTSARKHRGLGAGSGEMGAQGSVVYVGLIRDIVQGQISAKAKHRHMAI